MICHKGTKTQSKTFNLYLSSCLCVLVAKMYFIECKEFTTNTLMMIPT